MKKGNMVKAIKDGGLKVIDFVCFNGTLKTNWLKSWIEYSQSFWYCIPNYVFSKMDGLKLLFLTDFSIG